GDPDRAAGAGGAGAPVAAAAGPARLRLPVRAAVGAAAAGFHRLAAAADLLAQRPGRQPRPARLRVRRARQLPHPTRRPDALLAGRLAQPGLDGRLGRRRVPARARRGGAPQPAAAGPRPLPDAGADPLDGADRDRGDDLALDPAAGVRHRQRAAGPGWAPGRAGLLAGRPLDRPRRHDLRQRLAQLPLLHHHAAGGAPGRPQRAAGGGGDRRRQRLGALLADHPAAPEGGVPGVDRPPRRLDLQQRRVHLAPDGRGTVARVRDAGDPGLPDGLPHLRDQRSGRPLGDDDRAAAARRWRVRRSRPATGGEADDM
ncbi:MAG: hypothetical protein AVDCRST_MAG59-1035, partial [uncultured Thermomicrobiales bacterium]